MLHDQLASALVDVLKGLDVTAYKWVPRKLKPPCAVVKLPRLERTQPDQAEDHLGQNDYRYDFPVDFFAELTQDSRKVQAKLIATVESFVLAIDNLEAGPEGLVLQDLCTDVKVTVGEPFVDIRDQNRDLIGYETHVAVLSFQ